MKPLDHEPSPARRRLRSPYLLVVTTNRLTRRHSHRPLCAAGYDLARPRPARAPALQRAGPFLIEPDGTVYYESILSMPAGRPRLDDLRRAIDYWMKVGYPARGDA
jgi:hypothetical protein